MKYYIEITLLPNAEIALSFLMARVFMQVHLSLVEQQDTQGNVPVGISFPEYVSHERCTLLGSKVRLFAQEESVLARLDIGKWLNRLSDYVHYTSIRSVPANVSKYARWQRLQPKLDKEQRIVHQAKRRNITRAESEAHFEDFQEKPIKVPYIQMKSLSSGNNFSLFIKKIEMDIASVEFTFSTYGLSTIAGVPEFYLIFKLFKKSI